MKKQPSMGFPADHPPIHTSQKASVQEGASYCYSLSPRMCTCHPPNTENETRPREPDSLIPSSPLQLKSPCVPFDSSSSPEDPDKECVGVANLPNQVYKKCVERGFDFTLMVAGQSGLGKSTLVNSLFLTDLYKDRRLLNAEERIPQTVKIVKHMVHIEEKGIKLRLTIIDTPGFGDSINNTECWSPLVNYIDQQFESYFRYENGLDRKNIPDDRIHCCLYFISPFGQGLRAIDVKFMKALQEKVNIVPVLAKADSLTPCEVSSMKMRILEEMYQHGIKIFHVPQQCSGEEGAMRRQEDMLKDSIPFAVIGSNTVVEVGGRRVRARVYPWGIVEVENPIHSDFVLLRDLLIRSHMQDLIDATARSHYEKYRAHRINCS